MDNAIVVDDSACSMPTACATTTSSSSTRSSTRSATCTMAGQPLLGRLHRLQVGPRAQQQAGAGAARRPERLRDRDLRRRVPSAPRLGRAGARMVSPGDQPAHDRRMTVFRWILGVLGGLVRARRGLRLGPLHRLRVPALAGAGAALPPLRLGAPLFWFNVEVWGRVIWTIWTWNNVSGERPQRPRKPVTSGSQRSKSVRAWSLPSIRRIGEPA